MPPSWTGHFDAQTGISYIPWGRVLGREALLFHSPWRVRPGRMWVDFRLALPATKPIELSFGMAVGPDVAVPGRSDGVTFSCAIVGRRELMRVHHDKAEWRDYAFDLSAHAGTTVTLRLQVEPGPARNAGWDYSFFGDARIRVGQGRTKPSDILERVTGTRAYRATAGAEPVRRFPQAGA